MGFGITYKGYFCQENDEVLAIRLKKYHENHPMSASQVTLSSVSLSIMRGENMATCLGRDALA